VVSIQRIPPGPVFYPLDDLFNFIRLKNYLEGLLEREVDLVTEKALKDRLKDKILDQVEYVE